MTNSLNISGWAPASVASAAFVVRGVVASAAFVADAVVPSAAFWLRWHSA